MGRERYYLITRVEPAMLSVRGPGTLTVVARANLPRQGRTHDVSVPFTLVRVVGDTQQEIARFVVEEPLDRGARYTETDRYRPSIAAVFTVELPEGEANYFLEVTEEAPLGAAFDVTFVPWDDEPVRAEKVVPGPAPAPVEPQWASKRPGLVPRAGVAASLVAGIGAGPVVGATLRIPLGDQPFLELAIDGTRLSVEGRTPPSFGVGPSSPMRITYDTLPVRIGLGWGGVPSDVRPVLGVAAGITWGTETVQALWGTVDRHSSFLLACVEGRLGIEWSPASGVGPLVAQVRVLGHPALLNGQPLSDPLPVSTVTLEVGYHVGL